MDNNSLLIAAFAILVLSALVLFLIYKNRKDRKQIFPPSGSDPVEEERTRKEQKRDKL
jgi:hypothetical protein